MRVGLINSRGLDFGWIHALKHCIIFINPLSKQLRNIVNINSIFHKKNVDLHEDGGPLLIAYLTTTLGHAPVSSGQPKYKKLHLDTLQVLQILQGTLFTSSN